MSRILDEEELKWRARDDANALATVSQLEKDPERKKLAYAAAEEMLNDRAQDLEGLAAVASHTRAAQIVRQVKSNDIRRGGGTTTRAADLFQQTILDARR